MSKIVFQLPTSDSPGYLRRMRSALEFRERMSAGDPKPETVDALIDFLLPYVQEPENRGEAREALLDATQEQYNELLGAISGGNENPT